MIPACYDGRRRQYGAKDGPRCQTDAAHCTCTLDLRSPPSTGQQPRSDQIRSEVHRIAAQRAGHAVTAATRSCSARPSAIVGSRSALVTRSTARSSRVERPTRAACSCRPLLNTTVMTPPFAPAAMTWSLVRMYPLAWSVSPLPLPLDAPLRTAIVTTDGRTASAIVEAEQPLTLTELLVWCTTTPPTPPATRAITTPAAGRSHRRRSGLRTTSPEDVGGGVAGLATELSGTVHCIPSATSEGGPAVAPSNLMHKSWNIAVHPDLRPGREQRRYRPVDDQRIAAASTAAPLSAQCSPMGASRLPLRRRSAQKTSPAAAVASTEPTTPRTWVVIPPPSCPGPLTFSCAAASPSEEEMCQSPNNADETTAAAAVPQLRARVASSTPRKASSSGTTVCNGIDTRASSNAAPKLLW